LIQGSQLITEKRGNREKKKKRLGKTPKKDHWGKKFAEKAKKKKTRQKTKQKTQKF